jgi:hypothetical protein
VGRWLRDRYRLLVAFGIDPRKTIRSCFALPRYVADLRAFSRQLNGSAAKFHLDRIYPCLHDSGEEGGVASGQYFHQDLLVARRIFLNSPARHVDVGSRVDGFVAHVAAFREIIVADIRVISAKIPNVSFVRADLMSPPPEHLREFCDSLSCLHALEHFGLGRYGDPINCDGHLAGLKNIGALLRKGGKFYLSTPIGKQRIEFNAHRIFAVRYLLDCLGDQYRIDGFSYVDDRGDLHEGADLAPAAVADNFGCSLGLGIFEMTKL